MSWSHSVCVCVCVCVCEYAKKKKSSLCFNPLILIRSTVQGGKVPRRQCFAFSVCLARGALPAERRDSPSLRNSVALTLSLSMSLARTKAIWGAAESFSNKITLSICTLHGSDCGALRSPIPRLVPDLLLFLLRPSNPGLHDWLHLKAPHARGGSQQHSEIQKKRPPAHQTKLHSLKAMAYRTENEKEGSKREKRKTRVRIKKKDKSLLSLCDLGRQKKKLHSCITAPKGQNRRRPTQSCLCASMLM